ncbi:MAG: DUF1611 domain-containing protein [Thermoguttaceae bacterium]|jgi:uncharacterized NAD-dependent epimerase/dehydratase family protein|nr:DUF1611 domain-containing protein [Thermoguttaceae bacterium]
MSETPRRLVLLTEGYRDAHTAKTAINVIRYKPEDVVAVFDRAGAGATCQEWFGLGGSIPVVGSLADAPGANALLIGIAPPGGKIPAPWRPIVLEAIRRKLNVVSGLHDFLNDDAEFVQAAREHGVRLVDVRQNNEHDVAQRRGIREGCLRIHTVANDCSLGKMVVSVEVARGLQRRGVDAKFVATGQTGILIEGDGCPIDRVISDFVNGAAEKLVLANQHHEVIVIEGQGSLFHPRYSCVTLGLLHGSMPDGLIVCYEMGRTKIEDMGVPLASLEEVRDFYEAAARIMHPCRVIGVAINGARYSDAEVAAEREAVRRRMGLPACDVLRHGPDELVDAVLDLKRQLRK